MIKGRAHTYLELLSLIVALVVKAKARNKKHRS